MKKLLLSLTCITIAMLSSCSSDSAISTTEDNSTQYANRSTAWDGVIGVESDGKFYVTADEIALRADLEAILDEQGHKTSLGQLSIVEKTIINAPLQKAYILIGTDKENRSIGVSLSLLSQQFVLDNSLAMATSCTGCAQGCNLQYLLIDGKKVPYCNENGCDYNCTKSETGVK